MKYKVGDKFRSRKGLVSAFRSGEIVGVHKSGNWILSVEGHAQYDTIKHPFESETLVVRDEIDLDMYDLVPDFFEEGKAYRFRRDGIKDAIYEVTQVLVNRRPATAAQNLQALALRTHENESKWVLLEAGVFEQMEEDVNW